MIEVEMVKDIREYEPKIIGPFSLRQLVCIAVGIAYTLPIMSLIPSSMYVRVFVGGALVTPIILCGWVKFYGMPFEKFALTILKSQVLSIKKRTHGRENRHFLDEKPQLKGKVRVKRTKEYKGRS